MPHLTHTPAPTQQHIGSLAYVGSYAAVSDFTRSAYVKGAKLTGFASVRVAVAGAAACHPVAMLKPSALDACLVKQWLFWRSAYLSQQGSWRNRLQVQYVHTPHTQSSRESPTRHWAVLALPFVCVPQVPLDWLRTLVFGRDINSF